MAAPRPSQRGDNEAPPAAHPPDVAPRATPFAGAHAARDPSLSASPAALGCARANCARADGSRTRIVRNRSGTPRPSQRSLRCTAAFPPSASFLRAPASICQMALRAETTPDLCAIPCALLLRAHRLPSSQASAQQLSDLIHVMPQTLSAPALASCGASDIFTDPELDTPAHPLGPAHELLLLPRLASARRTLSGS
ncbi:hypothetical protein SCP_0200030 [Sparassis crispa]|uniref:Uncharacterized protein n=1 Tax=Sparassis crispa TaxID=139825 RepID=A0A401G9E3_9APHY|nr:hypothetical protein SCP_0200030 [Sparassis crispa]GBE78806.1 hypothetical protein SCP_0200030 [Sparassis crispa]